VFWATEIEGKKLTEFSPRLWVFSQSMAVLMIFSAPISRALFNISAALFLVSWFLSGGLRKKLEVAVRNPIAVPIFVMVGVMLLGILYTPAPKQDIVEHVRVYSKFFLVLLFVPVFLDERWRNRGVVAFLVAMALTVIATYINIWFDPPWSRTANQGFGADHSVFVDYIVQGVATSIFLGLCIFNFYNEEKVARKSIWMALFLLGLFSLVFLIQGRSGQFTFLAVLLLAGIILLPARYRIVSVLIGVIGVGALVYLSPLMVDRMMLIYSDVMQFLAGNKETSVGLRMYMWQFSFNSMLESPWLGKGTGSYHILAEQFFGHCNYTCFHPHNQYLFFGMEHGILGLAVYIWILVILAKATRSMSASAAFFMWCVWVVLVVDGLANAPLWYRMESYIFYTLLGLGVAAHSASLTQNHPNHESSIC